MSANVVDKEGVRHVVAERPSATNVGETVCGERFVWASSGGRIWHSMEGTERPTKVMFGGPNETTCLICLGS